MQNLQHNLMKDTHIERRCGIFFKILLSIEGLFIIKFGERREEEAGKNIISKNIGDQRLYFQWGKYTYFTVRIAHLYLKHFLKEHLLAIWHTSNIIFLCYTICKIFFSSWP